MLLLERMLTALNLPDSKEAMGELYAQMPDRDTAVRFVDWLYNRVLIFCDECHLEALQRPECAALHYRPHSEQGAAIIQYPKCISGQGPKDFKSWRLLRSLGDGQWNDIKRTDHKRCTH